MGIAESLRGQDSEFYGELHSAHVLELYKLYVDSADKVSSRRQSANSFYLTINTAVLAAVGGYLQLDPVSITYPVLFMGAGIVGIALCFLWRRSISSYRNLNNAKFKVIHEVEKLLPIRLFHAEWEAVGHGRDRRRYRPFTQVEIIIPWVFMLVHLAILVLFIPPISRLFGLQGDAG
jgi:hypothetical protein